MKKCMLLVFVILLFSVVQISAQTQREEEKEVDYPWVPRVSAYEAYLKYKDGKAIILHGGGGGPYSNRHILGAYNADLKDRDQLLRKFPKQGLEIFTYCY